MHALSGVTGVLGAFKRLQLKVEVLELFGAWHLVELDVKDCLQRFATFREFAHGSVMDRVTVHREVLLRQNVPVSL